MEKKDAKRKAAEAHDRAIRKWLKSQESIWQDKFTVLLALGYVLPEKSLTADERKHIKKRADIIIRDSFIKLIDGDDIDLEMRRLMRDWLLQFGRGRGRPRKSFQQHLIIQAVSDEYRKYVEPSRDIQKLLDEIGKLTNVKIGINPSLPMHKVIVGRVADRVGLSMERIKHLVPGGLSRPTKVLKRLARKSKRK